MNRLGFRHDNLRRTMPEVLASRICAFDAVYTHFATADDARVAVPRRAASAVRSRDGRARRDGLAAACGATPRTPPRCCATRARGTTGCGPACCSTASCRRRSAADLALRPALSLTSRIVAVKGAARRRGHRLRTALDAPTRRARSRSCRPATPTVSTRARPAAACVLVRGRRVPIVGAVCMDMITIDVTGLDVSPGDEVVLIGRQGDEEITAREIAADDWIDSVGSGVSAGEQDREEIRGNFELRSSKFERTATGSGYSGLDRECGYVATLSSSGSACDAAARP